MKNPFLVWNSLVRQKVNVTRSRNTCFPGTRPPPSAAAVEAPGPGPDRGGEPVAAELWGPVS